MSDSLPTPSELERTFAGPAMRLPTAAGLGPRPTPWAGPPARVETGAETLPGRALAGLGVDMQHVGQMIEEEQHRQDVTGAEGATNKAVTAATDLSYGQDGFLQKHGADASPAIIPGYMQRLNGKLTAIGQSLANDEQRQMFEQRAAIVRQRFHAQLLSHVLREQDAHAKDVTQSGIAVERQQAALSWHNPADVGGSIVRTNGLIDQEAKREGWTAEQVKAAQLQADSSVHTGVIEAALTSGDIGYAKDWLKVHRDEMTPEAALSASRMLKTAETAHANNVSKQIDSATSLILSGFPPTPEQLQPLVAAASGTPAAGDARQMVALARATRQFSAMPPDQQAQQLTKFEAAVRQHPTPQAVRDLQAFTHIHDNQNRDLQADPVGFAVSHQLIAQNSAAAQPLDVTDPQSLQQVLPARLSVARVMHGQYGAPMKPLSPDEASSLSDALRQAPAHEKLHLLGRIQAATGHDFAGYSAILGELAPDQPVTAIAGLYAARGHTQAADLMLRGQRILHPSKAAGHPDQHALWPMPASNDFRAAWADYVGDAYAGHPRARSDGYQAALAAYAALSSDAGDNSGVLDSDRWQKAMKLATGGVSTWNGKSTLLPYGLTLGQFKDGLYRRIDYLVTQDKLAPGVDAATLKDLPLEPIGDGRYVFRSGDGVMVDTTGKPLIVDFGTSPPTPLGQVVNKLSSPLPALSAFGGSQ